MGEQYSDGLMEVEWAGLGWISQDRDKWRAFVNNVLQGST